MTDFQYYQTYIAMKLHFSGSYDFFKYEGKVNVKPDKFAKSGDKHFIKKLKKKYGDSHFQYFLLSNYIIKNKKDMWVGYLANEESDSIYKDWISRIENLDYIFRIDCQNIYDNFGANNDVFRPISGTTPTLLKLFYNGSISLETMIIFDMVFGGMVFKYWNKYYITDKTWNALNFKIKKYKPFMEVSVTKYKKIMKKIFNYD